MQERTETGVYMRANEDFRPFLQRRISNAKCFAYLSFPDFDGEQGLTPMYNLLSSRLSKVNQISSIFCGYHVLTITTHRFIVAINHNMLWL
jgi:hypothetical protein